MLLFTIVVAAHLCVGALQVALVIALTGVYGLVFSPSIKGLNVALRNSRATLLQFPEDVINGIPSIRALVKEFAKANQQD